MLEVIDLRSDTVTRPTAAMRQAMLEAPVGDDVYEEDPTINRLQEQAAALLGKEAALFVPSGTMSNAIAIKVHTKPGDEILLDGEAHSMLYELGLPATIAHVLTRQFPSVCGVPDVEAVMQCLHSESLHNPGTSLLVLENTHNRAGGYIIPLAVHQRLFAWTQENGLRLHLDGARLFNAVVASASLRATLPPAPTRSPSVCPKGWAARSGRSLCGTREFIEKARRVRKMLGGGLRQLVFSRQQVCMRWTITSSVWQKITTMRAAWRREYKGYPVSL